jgi:hypothetical protein
VWPMQGVLSAFVLFVSSAWLQQIIIKASDKKFNLLCSTSLVQLSSNTFFSLKRPDAVVIS